MEAKLSLDPRVRAINIIMGVTMASIQHHSGEWTPEEEATFVMNVTKSLNVLGVSGDELMAAFLNSPFYEMSDEVRQKLQDEYTMMKIFGNGVEN